MSISERFNSDRAEATIAQVVVGGMIIGGGFLGINVPGLMNMFDINSPTNNQYVQEPIEPIDETPIDTTDGSDGEPMGDDWEDPSNTDGSDEEAPIEEPIEEESNANLLNITDAAECSGDILSEGGIIDFSVAFDAYLPAGTKITMPSWVYNNPGAYTQDSGIEFIKDDGKNAVFKVVDDGDGFGYPGYWFSTSKEPVPEDFKETVKIVLPDGYEVDSESVLEYDLSMDSPYCYIEPEW